LQADFQWWVTLLHCLVKIGVRSGEWEGDAAWSVSVF
jgi:hypothetical protein